VVGVLQCGAVCCSVVQCVAVWCGVLQCGAACCSVVQCVAVRRRYILARASTCLAAFVPLDIYISISIYIDRYACVAGISSREQALDSPLLYLWCVAGSCSVLQRVALCCSVSARSLQHVGKHFVYVYIYI